MTGATRACLPGGRLHLQHGPIDVVIGADGEAAAVAAAHEAAWDRFRGLLAALVAELPALRQPVADGLPCPLRDPVARAMWQAARTVHDGCFLTPMAAVAGAVADALAAAYRRPGIRRAWINDGGDIALVLAPGSAVTVGLYSDLARFDARQARDGPTVDGRFTVDAAMPVRGIATSGWRGRSLSLGIADSVTVLAATAALADAAATMIANAVDAVHPGIRRRPANAVKDDSDLGDIPVTVDVPVLPAAVVDAALDRGLARARTLAGDGRVAGAFLACQRRTRTLSPMTRTLSPMDKGVPPGATLPEGRRPDRRSAQQIGSRLPNPEPGPRAGATVPKRFDRPAP